MNLLRLIKWRQGMKLTAKQEAVLARMRELGVNCLDANEQGVAHLAGETVNGNMIRAFVRNKVMLVGNQPGTRQWRYTINEPGAEIWRWKEGEQR